MSPESRRDGSTPRRRRVAPLVWLGCLVAAVLLTLSVTGTISGFSASITNDSNTIGTGSLVLAETGPDATGTAASCVSSSGTDNSFTCSTINKYGDNGQTVTTLTPGQSVSTSVTFTNTGTTDASTFTLAPGTCTSTPTGGTNGDLCADLQVSIVSTTAGVTLTPAVSALAPDALPASTTISGGLTAGAADAFTVTVTLPAGATDADEGLTATQSLLWSIGS